MKHPVRWGIIGCGDVTEWKSGPAYQKTEGFILQGVMRRDGDKARDYARRHRVEFCTTDADELINHPEIDAVYIATPPHHHMEYGLRVAEAGKPCCVEKPFTVSHAQAACLVAAFAARDLPLFVAYYRRSLPRFEKVRELLHGGQVGELRQVSWRYSRPFTEQTGETEGKENWRTDAAVAPGGYFEDLGSHGLDLFAHLAGPFDRVLGLSHFQAASYTAKDAVSACWSHVSGALGTGYWNFVADRFEDVVELIGSQGRLTFSIFQDHPIRLERSAGTSEFRVEHPVHIQSPHVQNIRDALLGRCEHPSTGHSALATRLVLDQILA